MAEDKPIMFKGKPYIFIEITPCSHLFLEEVDYDFFQQISGESIAVPEGERPPIRMCGLHLHECFGRCPDFEPLEEEDP